MTAAVLNPERAGGSVPLQDGDACMDCGAQSESGYYDVGVHDCRSGKWMYVVMTLPETVWRSLPPDDRADWPTDRIVRGH